MTSREQFGTFIECGKCHKQWKDEVNGMVKCPYCGSGMVERMIMMGPKPDWFKGE